MTRRTNWVMGGVVMVGLAVLFATCGEEEQPTEILLTVTSTDDVDAVTLRVRNITYEDDQIRKEMAGRSIVDEPLVIRLLPSSIIPVGSTFLVHARGVINGENVVADAKLLTFHRNRSQTDELVMRADFIDADGDGFENCLRTGCDCNDLNPSVNPFTEENCDDFVDNNCSGWPINEGCPCDASRPWEQQRLCTTLPTEVQDLAGIGACSFGIQRCVNGIWEETCTGAGTFSTAEIPDNGVDDDCDGVVDEGSACSPPNTTRACFLGLVGSAAVAAAPAGSECLVGTQLCDNDGHWAAACAGETRPQRGPDGVGWAELPDLPGTPGQCDGRDNDCDGQVDEEVYFDGDLDGYTVCGTNRRTGCGDPLDKSCLDAGVSAEFKDCDDSNPCRNPGRQEDCRPIWFNPATEACEPSSTSGIRIDDDCRCDHGPNIGAPYVTLEGTTNCGDTFATLDCGNLPRSDQNPVGVCSETTPAISCPDCDAGLGTPACRACTDPYHHGYFPALGSSTPATDQDCHLCAEQFGYACSAETGTCTTKAEDCSTCDVPAPTTPADPERQRPYCTLAGPGCAGIDPPTWTPQVGTDENSECPGFSCTGYYCATGPGNSGLIGGECYEKTFQTDADVMCAGRELCQTAAELCPVETDCNGVPVAPPRICVTATAGCIGQTPPVWNNQANNSDIRNECPGSNPGNFDCNNDGLGAGGGAVTRCGPYFLRIEDDTPADGRNNPWCFFRADVPDTFCNDSGACQTCAEGCATSGARGGKEGLDPLGVFYRRPCTQPTAGCDQLTGPTYSPILDGTDPYDDCPVALDGTTNRMCNPALTASGGCFKDLGEVCLASTECQPPFTCVDGRCCQQTACGVCQACDVLAHEGFCWPHSRNNDSGTCEEQCTRCDDGSCVNRPAGDFTECTVTCQTCLTAAGGSCASVAAGASGFNCDANDTFCCNGTCVNPTAAANEEYGSSCGTGDCAGGTWGCSGASARCSSYNNPCDYCTGDTRFDAVCTAANGAQCNAGSGTGCPACQSCRDLGTTTECAATGGVNAYTLYTDDTNTPNTCSGTNTCDGAGNCEKENGQTCTVGGECASGNCVDSVCCQQSVCGTCEACNRAGNLGQCTDHSDANDPGTCDGPCTQCSTGSCVQRPAGAFVECGGTCQACLSPGGSCGAWTGASGTNCDNSDSYCCNGSCVNPPGNPSEYNGNCGSGDCAGGTWGCAGSTARCSSYNDACDYCGGDLQYDAVCTADSGATCGTGTSAECPTCFTCSDGGATVSCTALGLGVDDTTGSNQCTGNNTCNGSGTCKLKNGQACGADGTLCASGNCVDGVCCQQASCGVCEACNRPTNMGQCTDHSENDDPGTCVDDCTRCNAGACVQRNTGDATECVGTCQACDSPGGNCAAYTGATGLGCSSNDTFCCAGSCVNPTAAAGEEYNSSCGTGDCGGGTWGCNGTNPRCSSYNSDCQYCTNDTRYLALCTNSYGAACNTGGATASDCSACQSCRDDGDTTTCVATGGVNSYPQDTDDAVGPNTCSGNNTCNGGGQCRLKDGQPCGTNGALCASSYCVDTVCCGSSSCTTCHGCNEGTPGSCSAQTGASGTGCASADNYCCAGSCVNPTGNPSEYGAACGAGDCSGGTWDCNGASAQCTSYNNPCDYCGTGAAGGDNQYDAVCTGNQGTTCGTGTATGCAACTSCQDNGATTSCVANGVNNYSVALTDDPNTPNTCTGTQTCDGAGECKKDNGETCAANSECASGNCAGAPTGTCS